MEIFIILLLIVVNGILAMAEIAVVSARKARLQQLAETGNAGAGSALDLANQPSHFLSTVQIGITLIGILAGAFGGATVAGQLEVVLNKIPFLAPYSKSLGVAVVVVGTTYLSLVIGELAPKQIALNDPERIASAMAPMMKQLSRLASPLVHFLSLSTNIVVRLLGVRPSLEPSVTEEEIRILIEQGTEVGVFEPVEEEMVEQVFRLGDLRVKALMTPRLEMVWLDLDDPLEKIQDKVATSGYSQFPVAQGGVDRVMGLVRAKDLLIQCMAGCSLDLMAGLQPPLFIPESMPAFETLERFKETGLQMAFVLDEYGGIQGLVTTTDILEAIVGDIRDVDEPQDPDIVQREDGSYLLDGMITNDEFKELFQIKELPGEQDNYFHTLGGFVMTFLGRIPSESDHFEWEGLRFEVIDMDGRRIDKVLVRQNTGDQEAA